MSRNPNLNLRTDYFSVEDVKRGYSFDAENQTYICVDCQESFEKGEVFLIDGRFFEAERAVKFHVENEHPDYIMELIDERTRHITITENQRELLKLIAAGKSDKEISKITGSAPATIRHQRFIFREKAKFARKYLAMYETVLERSQRNGEKTKELDELQAQQLENSLLLIPEYVRMADERFIISVEERSHVLKTAFSSLYPLRLKQFSPKEKKKVIILMEVTKQFELNRDYSEREVNQILFAIYDDFVTLRRYLVDYGFMLRSEGGRMYRRAGELDEAED